MVNTPQTFENVAAQIATRLRKLRTEKDYCQQYIADYLGVSQSYYSRLERGKADISLTDLVQIANGLKISLTDLITGPQETESRYTNDEFIHYLKSSIDYLREQNAYFYEQNRELLEIIKKNQPSAPIKLKKV